MSRKQVALTLAVVALVAIGGCMGGSGGTNSTTTSISTTEQTTESTTTTDKAKTLSSISLPNGITESEVSETTLVKTHTKSLKERSFTNEISIEIVSAAGSDNPVTLTQSLAVTANLPNKTALTTMSYDGETRRVKYMNGGTVATKSVSKKNGATSFSITDRTLRTSELTGTFLYQDYFEGLNLKPVEVESKHGQTLITLEVKGYSDKQQIKNSLKASSLSTPEGTATVTLSGRIRSLNFTIPYSPQKTDTRAKVSVSLRTNLKETTSITEPSWTSKAKKQSVDAEVTLQNQKYISITPTNSKIPEGTTIHIFTKPTGKTKVTVGSTIQTGSTLYLYVEEGNVKLSTSKPTATTKFKVFSLAAVSPDGSELFRANG